MIEPDVTNARTAAFEARREHQHLLTMVGSWEGPTRTWFDPTAAPEESRTRLRIESVLQGRFVRIDYQGTIQGNPHAGQMILGYEDAERRFTSMWIDSFHMGTGIMVSSGAQSADGALALLGSYPAGEERWGWRTLMRIPDPDHLVIEAYNITPAGREDRAIETRLSRRA